MTSGLRSVMERGLEPLTRIKSVRILDLSGTQISDAGMVHLEKLGHVRNA